MPLFLTEANVRQLLDMPTALAALERAHCALSLGRANDVPRQRTRLPQTALHILQGALPAEDAIGYKVYTSNRSGVRSLVHLYSASSGRLRAVIEAEHLGVLRTSAASGLATRCLAKPEASIAGVFGAGLQAAGHLEALAAVRPLQLIKVYARNQERLALFCHNMTARLNIPVIASASAEATVRDSAIVSTLTTSASPLFNAEWLAPDAHINAAGANSLIRRELGEDVLKRCRIIVVDAVDTALREAGDLLPWLEKGRLQARQLVELGDLLSGRHHAANATSGETAVGVSLFESQGMAIQDLALAVQLEARARAQGIGAELPYGQV
ncbi:MAG: ornithine cyclodeaminase family protein [Pseudomonadota bacterium]